MSSPMLPRCLICARSLESGLRLRLRRLAAEQDGSFLVEALVSALILVIVGLGVLESIDRASALGGEQKVQSVAGNVAQSEQEQLRALPLSEQSNLRRATARTVGGVTYSIASRADWVNDTSGDTGCATAGSTADYLKVSTVVTWPDMGTRKPVTLDSLVSPGVKAFDATQGSLAVQVTDRAGAGLSGLQLNLSGPATFSDTTNASGCVLWGYLPAGSGYNVGFSKPPDYITTTGSPVVSEPVTIIGEQTKKVAVQYDRGGYLQTTFVTRKRAGGADIPTSVQEAHVTNSGGGGVSVPYTTFSGSTATSPIVFPFTSAWTVHPDSCAAGEVPTVPERPDPDDPAAPSAIGGIVTPGVTTTTTAVRIPSPNIRVRAGSTPSTVSNRVGAHVKVTTPCGTVYRRTTITGGVLADPGFPYTPSLTVCVDDSTRRTQTTISNTNFNNDVTYVIDIPASTSPLGTCG